MQLGTQVLILAPLPRAGIFGRHQALRGGGVGQLRAAGDVADRINGGHLGSAVFVNVDETVLIGREPGVLELQFLGHRLAPQSRQQQIRLELFSARRFPARRARPP